MSLNRRALNLVDAMIADAAALRVAVQPIAGARVVDCGAAAQGGLEAGRRLAEVCLGGLGTVSIGPGSTDALPCPTVAVRTDAPVHACMAAQYAGWEVKGEDYFAMGSGPMRAAAAREALIQQLELGEQADVAVGVLETDKPPTEAVCQQLAERCGVGPNALTLLYAPVTSVAGTVQVVARSVETALHKLHELGFDLGRIASGWGTAPLPPPAADTLGGIGRTNDAILYGGSVVLYVRGDDDSLGEVGAQTPSNASADYGRPFAEVFASYDHDFYKIDKMLFSPARVTFCNLDTGNSFTYGKLDDAVLDASFNS